jgi:CxxC motif-containing protein (DUF1111 family)
MTHRNDRTAASSSAPGPGRGAGRGPAHAAWRSLLIFCSVAAISACAHRSEPGDPLPGLTRSERDQFVRGRAVFSREFTPETGLGPLFNSTSCGECHEEPKLGGVGDEVELHATAFLTRSAAPGPGGQAACDLLARFGGPVFQSQTTPALKAALKIDEEPVPPEATGRAQRSTPELFGLGLLDAVPDDVILAYADPDDRDHDGISGRPNHSPDGRLGRFGRKAFVPTLREFTAGAFLIEQGITSPAQPVEETIGGRAIPPGVDPVPEPEITQEDLDLAVAFVRLLAPPSPRRAGTAGRQGRRLFETIGCAACHAPRLKSGDDAVAALRHREIAAFTDLLLHDMGPELADICLGEASPAEFRTEPLMGLRLRTKFLHDGRATSIEEAILQHGGEGSGSRDRFKALPSGERAALLAFLQSL